MTLTLLALYLLALRSVFSHEQALRPQRDAAADAAPVPALTRDWRRFGLAAVVVVVVATYLLNAALVFLHGDA